MKSRELIVAVISLIAFTPAASAQDSGAGVTNGGQPVRNPYNPPGFQQFIAAPSSPIAFLLSPQGQSLVGSGAAGQGLYHIMGVPFPTPAQESNIVHLSGVAPRSGIVSGPQTLESPHCDAQNGTPFNLQGSAGIPEIGFPVPQNEESVDFIPRSGIQGADLVVAGANDLRGFFVAADNNLIFAPNDPPNSWGTSSTGYYVKRTFGGCAADFEGGLPHTLFTANLPGVGIRTDTLTGGGDPVIAVDATRGNVYAADLRFGRFASGIGLFRTSASYLNNPMICPSGTHLTDAAGNEAVQESCWPIRAQLGSSVLFFSLPDKPHLRADERAAGVGAGDVYVTWTYFNNNAIPPRSEIHMAVCPATFKSAQDCSPDQIISGDDQNTQFSHIAVRPDGAVTVTYVNVQFTEYQSLGIVTSFFESHDIKYVSCTPNGAPKLPACSTASLVATENQPLPFEGTLASSNFRTVTYPTHDQHQVNGQWEEVVAWSRCKTSPFIMLDGLFEFFQCGDADVVMTSSKTGKTGAPWGWSPVSPVNDELGDQIFPWVKTNHESNTVNITYYSSQNDQAGHRFQLLRSRLAPGSGTPVTDIVSPGLIDSNADFVEGGAFMGDYIGMASRGESTYLNFTSLTSPGIVGGNVVNGESNNLVQVRQSHPR